MNTLFLTGRELNYQRNEVIFRAFRRFSLVKTLSVKIRPRSLMLNSFKITLRSVPKILFNSFDLIFVGFYGHLMMLPISRLARSPILFDAFVSTYDTLIEDRRVSAQYSLMAKLARWLDRTACNLADHVLLDTQHHVAYFINQFGLKHVGFSTLPVGCNEDIFYPRTNTGKKNSFRVLYYTSYLPLHGVDVVLKAAEELRDHPVNFRLIGSGQTFLKATQLAAQLRLNNIEFIPPVPVEQLADEIAAADICLGGHFGSSPKAGRVIPGKVYQILAMARPLIASDTPANRELLSHVITAYLCRPNDPISLAEGIKTLLENHTLCERIAQNGYQLFREKCSEAIITNQLQRIMTKLIS